MIRKPTFLYAGTAKAGSSWLYETLLEHPEVFIPDAKDIMFFSKEYNRGLEWYYNFFKVNHSYKAYGEICHDYYLKKAFAERIHAHLPEVQLIFCLREPVDWTVSAQTFMSAAVNTSNDFLEFLNQNSYTPEIKWGDYLNYYENLKHFYLLFPRENILILFYDQLKLNSLNFICEIFSFIGVNEDFIPSMVNTKINPSHEARNQMIGHLAYKSARVTRCLGMQNFLGRMKRNRLINRCLYRNTTNRNVEMDEETTERIYERYAAQYHSLEKLIDKELPQSWYRR